METVSMIAAILLPLWNIPLITHMEKRKSSQDVSLWWTFGVWVCFLLMLPAGLASPDAVFKVFSAFNIVMFTAVVIQVMRYRKS